MDIKKITSIIAISGLVSTSFLSTSFALYNPDGQEDYSKNNSEVNITSSKLKKHNNDENGNYNDLIKELKYNKKLYEKIKNKYDNENLNNLLEKIEKSNNYMLSIFKKNEHLQNLNSSNEDEESNVGDNLKTKYNNILEDSSNLKDAYNIIDQRVNSIQNNMKPFMEKYDNEIKDKTVLKQIGNYNNKLQTKIGNHYKNIVNNNENERKYYNDKNYGYGQYEKYNNKKNSYENNVNKNNNNLKNKIEKKFKNKIDKTNNNMEEKKLNARLKYTKKFNKVLKKKIIDNDSKTIKEKINFLTNLKEKIIDKKSEYNNNLIISLLDDWLFVTNEQLNYLKEKQTNVDEVGDEILNNLFK